MLTACRRGGGAVPPIPNRWLDQVPATTLAGHSLFLAALQLER